MSEFAAVKLSDLVDEGGVDLKAYAKGQTHWDKQAKMVEAILLMQLRQLQAQVGDLAQLKDEYLDSGGRNFFCSVIEERQPVPRKASTAQSSDSPGSFEPSDFAEMLHDLLDHEGHVLPNSMTEFVDLCVQTRAVHQRAVLVSILEHLPNEQFRQFIHGADGSTRGLELLKVWASAATMPPDPPKLSYTKRETDWCIQISAHVLVLLQKQVASHAVDPRDKAFWQSLLPVGVQEQKRNPLVKLIKGVHKSFQKGIPKVTSSGATRRNSVYNLYQSFRFESLIDRLKEATNGALQSPSPEAHTSTKRVRNSVSSLSDQTPTSNPTQSSSSKARHSGNAKHVSTKTKHSSLSAAPPPADGKSLSKVRPEVARRTAAKPAAGLLLQSSSRSSLAGVNDATQRPTTARRKASSGSSKGSAPSTTSSTVSPGTGRTESRKRKASSVPTPVALPPKQPQVPSTTKKLVSALPGSVANLAESLKDTNSSAGKSEATAPRVKPTISLLQLPSSAPVKKKPRRKIKIKWADNGTADDAKRGKPSLESEIPFFMDQPVYVLLTGGTVPKGYSDARDWKPPAVLGSARLAQQLLPENTAETQRIEAWHRSQPQATRVTAKSRLSATTKGMRPQVSPSPSTKQVSFVLPKHHWRTPTPFFATAKSSSNKPKVRSSSSSSSSSARASSSSSSRSSSSSSSRSSSSSSSRSSSSASSRSSSSSSSRPSSTPSSSSSRKANSPPTAAETIAQPSSSSAKTSSSPPTKPTSTSRSLSLTKSASPPSHDTRRGSKQDAQLSKKSTGAKSATAAGAPKQRPPSTSNGKLPSESERRHQIPPVMDVKDQRKPRTPNPSAAVAVPIRETLDKGLGAAPSASAIVGLDPSDMDLSIRIVNSKAAASSTASTSNTSPSNSASSGGGGGGGGGELRIIRKLFKESGKTEIDLAKIEPLMKQHFKRTVRRDSKGQKLGVFLDSLAGVEVVRRGVRKFVRLTRDNGNERKRSSSNFSKTGGASREHRPSKRALKVTLSSTGGSSTNPTKRISVSSGSAKAESTKFSSKPTPDSSVDGRRSSSSNYRSEPGPPGRYGRAVHVDTHAGSTTSRHHSVYSRKAPRGGGGGYSPVRNNSNSGSSRQFPGSPRTHRESRDGRSFSTGGARRDRYPSSDFKRRGGPGSNRSKRK